MCKFKTNRKLRKVLYNIQEIKIVCIYGQLTEG